MWGDYNAGRAWGESEKRLLEISAPQKLGFLWKPCFNLVETVFSGSLHLAGCVGCVRNARTRYTNLKQWRACLRHTPYSRLVRSLGWETRRFTLFVGLRLRITQSTLIAVCREAERNIGFDACLP